MRNKRLKTRAVARKSWRKYDWIAENQTKRQNREWSCVQHFLENVTYIFLWFRVKDKLAWLSFCEECSKDCSFFRAGNHRYGGSQIQRESGRGERLLHISSCNFTCWTKRNFWLKRNIFCPFSPLDENIHGPSCDFWNLNEQTDRGRGRLWAARRSRLAHTHSLAVGRQK